MSETRPETVAAVAAQSLRGGTGNTEHAAATADDVDHAMNLPHPPRGHIKPLATGRASVFASEEAQVLLRSHSGEINQIVGVEGTEVAALAGATRDRVAPMQRLVESANRSIEEYLQLRAKTRPVETKLLGALRAMPEGAPLRLAFKNILGFASEASGAPKRTRTKRRNLKDASQNSASPATDAKK